jgi:hypothetical protein
MMKKSKISPQRHKEHESPDGKVLKSLCELGVSRVESLLGSLSVGHMIVDGIKANSDDGLESLMRRY